jgi:hypothetical protein
MGILKPGQIGPAYTDTMLASLRQSHEVMERLHLVRGKSMIFVSADSTDAFLADLHRIKNVPEDRLVKWRLYQNTVTNIVQAAIKMCPKQRSSSSSEKLDFGDEHKQEDDSKEEPDNLAAALERLIPRGAEVWCDGSRNEAIRVLKKIAMRRVETDLVSARATADTKASVRRGIVDAL